ncbi:hypothetical protein MHIP_02680 [Mycolicibacterium hippocampi]|uniref:Uncharacterized protein n=1 Tax=Mycolicibacterium hippocampi TaxID=659824 RepID=A0A7I9ZFH7_9MYCO|nr:hypothetical protein MHIP_02680 [Mycolicibacterium hippocampi]
MPDLVLLEDLVLSGSVSPPPSCRSDTREWRFCDGDVDSADREFDPSDDDAELPDDSDPVSEESAEATPWPVVMATPNPKATAPARSH